MKFTAVLFSCMTLLLSKSVANESDCPSHCQDLSLRNAVINLWKLPLDLTPLLKEYKNNLISLTTTSPEYTGLVVGQSLFAVDILTNFNPDVSMSCLFSRIIRETLGSIFDIANPKDYNRAVLEFQNLTLAAFDNSIGIGLIAAGCAVEEQKVQPYKEMECPIDEPIVEYLNNYADVPLRLRGVINKMIMSSDEKDRAIALAATATLTKPVAKVFRELLKHGGLMEALRIKGCDNKIPTSCCVERKVHLKFKMARLKATLQVEIPKLLMKQNVQ